jgi:hypothetical protein
MQEKASTVGLFTAGPRLTGMFCARPHVVLLVTCRHCGTSRTWGRYTSEARTYKKCQSEEK